MYNRIQMFDVIALDIDPKIPSQSENNQILDVLIKARLLLDQRYQRNRALAQKLFSRRK